MNDDESAIREADFRPQQQPKVVRLREPRNPTSQQSTQTDFVDLDEPLDEDLLLSPTRTVDLDEIEDLTLPSDPLCPTSDAASFQTVEDSMTDLTRTMPGALHLSSSPPEIPTQRIARSMKISSPPPPPPTPNPPRTENRPI
ncbi:hypothetical protein NUU61_001388 [Penicillium alfredii]|uniref:Uncharacterized protein n=1 Tax=Penicillium alfredii TaxID=1506179 RepID=A0A9W9G490_9EURO|nr:uncharacterized protein NUU61_001388 [Penicillium alfredii]KAJ5111758.1 hypothetical protein NUU61_001388 [Penicillium alfredii]